MAPLILFEHPFSSPAENLAADEALLEHFEVSGETGFLRFWESAVPFVVLGYSKPLEKEVFREACADLGIPVLRRCSGGGTVLQGVGCLNYALVLPLGFSPELETIPGANRFIMERIRAAVAGAAGLEVQVLGHTDLCCHERKFSGNAQRRKKRSLLFHGSFLVDFDLSLIGQTLRLPALQPEYRAGRDHADFLMNLPVSRKRLVEALTTAWKAQSRVEPGILDSVLSLTADLVRSKYSRREWNERSSSAAHP